MFDNWWKAHELEYVVGGVAIGIVLLVMGIYLAVLTVKDVRRRRRRLDDQLRAERERGGKGDGGHGAIVVEERD